MWSFDEKQNHINELEPAVFFGVKSRETCIKSDNARTVCYLNAMCGTKSPHCNTLTKRVWLCWMENDI